jgi:hydroxypyruvate reductase
MNRKLRQDAQWIAEQAIAAVRPDEAVRRALEHVNLSGKVYLVAVGKAAWQMAAAAVRELEKPVYRGIVITKYGHVMGELPGITCYEAGHPVPDANSFSATQAVLDMTAELGAEDTVLFLLSGGGSALFEKPLVEPEVLQEVTRILLGAGADITRINTIRKRLSAVKGGRFAAHCAPARIESIILSDILGDPVDMIASGPAAADPVTAEEAKRIGVRYGVAQLPGVAACLETETPKRTPNVHTQIIGSVRELCRAAENAAASLGYECIFLTDRMEGEASETGRQLAQELKQYAPSGSKIALIAGGETVVHLKGTGLGGRNQELVLAAATVLDGMPGAAMISVGSDGTDGPTDAAGGYVDGDTVRELAQKGLDIREYLDNNDSYHALEAVGNLIITGPTGTNVNDVTVCLLDNGK